MCTENPATSQNCSKFKIPWGNRPCFITSAGAGASKRGGGMWAKRHGIAKRRGIAGIHPQAAKGRKKSRDAGNDHRPALEQPASETRTFARTSSPRARSRRLPGAVPGRCRRGWAGTGSAPPQEPQTHCGRRGVDVESCPCSLEPANAPSPTALSPCTMAAVPPPSLGIRARGGLSDSPNATRQK